MDTFENQIHPSCIDVAAHLARNMRHGSTPVPTTRQEWEDAIAEAVLDLDMREYPVWGVSQLIRAVEALIAIE